MSKRLTRFIEHKGLSVLSFEKSIGTRSTVQNYIENDSNLGVKWFTKIFEVYPELSAEWLFKGEGEMLVSDVDMNVFKAIEILDKNADEVVVLESFDALMDKLGTKKLNKELEERLKRLEDKLGK